MLDMAKCYYPSRRYVNILFALLSLSKCMKQLTLYELVSANRCFALDIDYQREGLVSTKRFRQKIYMTNHKLFLYLPPSYRELENKLHKTKVSKIPALTYKFRQQNAIQLVQ